MSNQKKITPKQELMEAELAEEFFKTKKAQNDEEKSSVLSTLIGFFWTMVSFFAIFLSFKCNRGFNLGSFLAACCCAPFYVAYKLGTSWRMCFA